MKKRASVITLVVLLILLLTLQAPVSAKANPVWFATEEELSTWLDKHVIGQGDIGIPLRGHYEQGEWVIKLEQGQLCVLEAELLMNLALADGYLLLPIPINHGYLWDELVFLGSGSGGKHIGLWTWIANTYYYIEPSQGNKITELATPIR